MECYYVSVASELAVIPPFSAVMSGVGWGGGGGDAPASAGCRLPGTCLYSRATNILVERGAVVVFPSKSMT